MSNKKEHIDIMRDVESIEDADVNISIEYYKKTDNAKMIIDFPKYRKKIPITLSLEQLTVLNQELELLLNKINNAVTT